MCLNSPSQWLREDSRVLGISAWHWDTCEYTNLFRSIPRNSQHTSTNRISLPYGHVCTDHFCCPKAASSDLYFWGVTSMPLVRARLVQLSKEFGSW